MLCLHSSFNSYGVFMSASEDETGTLYAVEEKIARATKLPRSHGEVTSLLNLLSRYFENARLPDLLNEFSYGFYFS